MATTNDLKNGLVLNLDGDLWAVVEFQHVKPGKGGAFVRTTLKNVLSGKVVDKTFNAGTKVETASVDKRTMQYCTPTATATSSWTSARKADSGPSA
jgi:elongation factor P